MAQSNGCDFGCYIGELWGVFKRPAKIRAILGTILVSVVFKWPTEMGAILVNCVGYVSGLTHYSGPLK